MNTGTLIGARMKERKVSYRRLAKATGLHVSSLHRMVHGTQEVSVVELAAIAAALECAAADLMPPAPNLPAETVAAGQVS